MHIMGYIRCNDGKVTSKSSMGLSALYAAYKLGFGEHLSYAHIMAC